MRAVVTGAAGFIGSSIVDALLADGHDVLGVDCFTHYYDPAAKRANLQGATAQRDFSLRELDLREAELVPLIDGADVVFHQAAQPGVRLSWSGGFAEYDSNNVLATQRLLEAASKVQIGRFVYASSSSVYGNAPQYPTTEDDLPRPYSPYGVTKLAAEHLCTLYAANWGLSTISLRYFTVYGPRQRPDMAFYRLFESVISGKPFPLYGDGTQRRDFTFVTDAVAANLLAATADVPAGTIVNIAGGTTVEMNEVLAFVSELTGSQLRVDRRPDQPGDVHETGGAIDRARDLLGWEPQTSLDAGLVAQYEWQHRTAA